MRSLLFCALALAACGDDTTMTTTTDLAVADLAIHTTTCPDGCPPCSTGLTCVTDNGGAFPFAATCLSTCQTDADCGARTCVAIAEVPGRYCLAANEPNTCGVHCDGPLHQSACAGDTLVTNYVGLVCGDSYHLCATGCVEDNPDGGSDRQAHCR